MDYGATCNDLGWNELNWSGKLVPVRGQGEQIDALPHDRLLYVSSANRDPAVNLSAQTSPDHRRREPSVFYARAASQPRQRTSRLLS
jgi:hypothetical protein